MYFFLCTVFFLLQQFVACSYTGEKTWEIDIFEDNFYCWFSFNLSFFCCSLKWQILETLTLFEVDLIDFILYVSMMI